MKKIKILGAGIYQVPLIRTARRMGLYTIVVSIPGDYPGFALADKIYELNTRDKEAILAAAEKEQIDGICTSGTDVAVSTIGYVCEKMHLSGIPYEAAEILTDKAKMKDAFRQGGVSAADGIVIHYTANPGSTAMQNRDYFENLPETQEAQASSHFVVGIEGEVVQCIPTSEWSYASNQRNFDTISIECCHPDDSGEFTDETYNSVVQLAGFLCKRFNLTSDDVIRHYDVTEKLCPLYYVEHEDAWIQMKADIQAYADSLS